MFPRRARWDFDIDSDSGTLRPRPASSCNHDDGALCDALVVVGRDVDRMIVLDERDFEGAWL